MNTEDRKKSTFAFIKYGNREHLKKLQKGEMYFSPIQYFAGKDESDGIGDRYENVYKIEFGENVAIDLRKDHDAEIQMIRQPDGNYLSLFRKTNTFINYFCLYTVFGDTNFEKQTQLLLSDKMKAYDHMLLIVRPSEFLRRVDEGLKKANVKIPQRDFITYVDVEKQTGEKSYFDKPNRYSYQNEYRIGFLNTAVKVETIDIGDISDITALYTLEEVKKLRIFRDQKDIRASLLQINDRHFKEADQSARRYQEIRKEVAGKNDPESIERLKSAYLKTKKTMDDYESFVNSVLLG